MNQIDKQIESFVFFVKNADKSRKTIDLTDIDSFTLSAVMRKLNERCDQETIKNFLDVYFECFNDLVDDSDNLEQDALKKALEEFADEISIQKNAALDSPDQISSHMVNIIHLLIQKIKPESRAGAVQSLKSKLSAVDVNDMANKNMPASSAIGQSISFVKNILFDKDPTFIKNILAEVVNKL